MVPREKLGTLTPLVSVVIPSRNRADMLREALDSVIRQTYREFEVIVVDDGSRDHTRDVASTYDDRIRYIYQESRGRSEARNSGVLASKGEYVAFLDDDDVWYPRKLDLQVAVLDHNRDVDVVYGAAVLVGEGSRDLLSAELPPPDSLLERLISSKWIMPAAASVLMVRRTALERSGLFDRTVEPFEDWELWVRLAASGAGFAQLREPLAEYRMHESNSLRDREFMLAGHLAALEKILGSPGTPASIRTRRNHYLSRGWLFAGNQRYVDAQVGPALEAWCRAVRLDPSVFTPRLLAVMVKSLLGPRLLTWARVAKRDLMSLRS